MKDIGSIFPIYESDYQKVFKPECPLIQNRTLLSLGREGFYLIAQKHQNLYKRVLIPAYTCHTVITPFAELGWECGFYGVTKELRIDTQGLLSMVNTFKPSMIVVHPYYGMDFNSAEVKTLQTVHDSGIIIIRDNTQCIFSTQKLSCIDYEVGSFRKWFPIPDGGYIENFSVGELPVNDCFNQCQEAAMYLRGSYFENGDQRIKDISIRLNKQAVASSAEGVTAHVMSNLSKSILTNEDFERNIARRDTNFRFLQANIKNSTKVTKVYDTIPSNTLAPLYFPLYVENREQLQKELAANHIYAPILWGIETDSVRINKTIDYIYSHILVIPIDQRYDESDMARIINIVNR